MRPGSGPWHIFHFIGHGGFDALREEGLLALCDSEGHPDTMTATELGREIADHPTLRLVVLNACESATAAKRDIFSSTAATLVRRGVPAAIAMQYEITDRAAVEFTELFYEALAEGLPVDAAVTDARKGLSNAIRDTLEWGIPVLMTRSPDGVIFDVQNVLIADPSRVEVAASVEPTTVALPLRQPRVERPAAPIAFDWVTIPAGEFLMGSDKTKDKLAYDDETPQHTLKLPEYRIARVPVTVAQFAAFMAATRIRTRAEVQGSASIGPARSGRTSKAPTGRTRAGRRAMCGRSRITPSRACRGMTRSPSANGPACGCRPRRSGRRPRAAQMVVSGRGGTGSRTTGYVTST